MTRLSPDQEHSTGELVKMMSEQVSTIVGAALLAAAGGAALVGKQRLQRATPPVPAEAVASVKADVEEIKERTHHERTGI
jgi:hypothetical protein